jgi:hypothetical protein
VLRPDVPWEVCSAHDCVGVAVADGRCLAHLDERKLDDMLRARSVLDGRGVRFGVVLLDRIRSTYLRGSGNRQARIDAYVDMERAIFEDPAWLSSTVFGADTRFSSATFESDARFDDVVFERDARFDGAVFGGEAWFEGAAVRGDASFANARFEQRGWFNDMTVERTTTFSGATSQDGLSFQSAGFLGGLFVSGGRFGDVVTFGHARFEGPVELSGTRFELSPSFTAARFDARAIFEGVELPDGADFRGATFAGTSLLMLHGDGEIDLGARFERALQPSIVQAQTVTLDNAVFAERVMLAIRAETVECRRAHFRGGASLAVHECTTLSLDGTEFARGSRVFGHAGVPSLAGTIVGGVAFAGLDLSSCRFAGAINLDAASIDPTCTFARTPRSWRWTDRQVIADERIWRGWIDGTPIDPGQIAPLYRALRKGREEAKDQPGAADFYYGEMEMRRHAADAWPERLLLTLYWLVSGYGLRAWRALAALTLVVLVCAFLFDAWGLERQASFGDALLFSVQSTTSLLRGPEAALTTFGDWLWIALRLLGPILLALALLSLRGRVRR